MDELDVLQSSPLLTVSEDIDQVRVVTPANKAVASVLTMILPILVPTPFYIAILAVFFVKPFLAMSYLGLSLVALSAITITDVLSGLAAYVWFTRSTPA